MNFRLLMTRLGQLGILTLSDKALPSVVGLVAGRRVRGSWWGHEKGHEIFRDLERLEAHPDTLSTRLVSGKVTYLHRRLWPDLLSVATAREGWQTKGLSSAARQLLKSVARKGEIRMDRYLVGRDGPKFREAAREIEGRLLVYTDEIHTEKGSHTKILMTWSRCPKIRDQRFPRKSPAAARTSIESLVDELNRKYGGNGRLPWRQ
jgi:hypothetical protein